jgi:hypothetical protein
VATEKRNPGKFTVIELMGYGDVFVEQASDPAASLGTGYAPDE